ncbi:hypothetical protein V6N12_042104 [Hibiscus sabdariffa]|uniref:Uncharacterized protein n=1 Tax=Hibiscus sabdariffa TaxID=183260 RepID=A0ABR2EE64_9ROSI
MRLIHSLVKRLIQDAKSFPTKYYSIFLTLHGEVLSRAPSGTSLTFMKAQPQPPSDTNQALRAGTASTTIEHRMNGSLRLLVKDYGDVNIWPTSILSTEMRFVVHHYFMKDAN